MSGSSTIEWTDATWNPVTGCTRVSPGCAHCYIERTPPFRMEGRRFTRGGVKIHGSDGATTGLRLHEDRLEQPLRWRKPRRVFVNSLSDLFHEDVPDDFIRDVVDVMARAEQHTFQVLTKRPRRIFEWFEQERSYEGWYAFPENVWVGVSVENARHTWRADLLRAVPAYTKFISAEPLLGSLFDDVGESPVTTFEWDCNGEAERISYPIRERGGPLDLSGIDWVIVGGESGPGARPMHPDWAREIRDACLAPRGTLEPGDRPAFFFKQWGQYAPWIARERSGGYGYVTLADGTRMASMGKKRAGRELDGRTWDEFPATVAVPA